MSKIQQLGSILDLSQSLPLPTKNRRPLRSLKLYIFYSFEQSRLQASRPYSGNTQQQRQARRASFANVLAFCCCLVFRVSTRATSDKRRTREVLGAFSFFDSSCFFFFFPHSRGGELKRRSVKRNGRNRGPWRVPHSASASASAVGVY